MFYWKLGRLKMIKTIKEKIIVGYDWTNVIELNNNCSIEEIEQVLTKLKDK